MRPLIIFSLFLVIALCNTDTFAQGKLPEFTLKEIAPGKVAINWINPYKKCTQLSVQRSEDNKKFKTIIAAKKPNLYQNGFIDTKSAKNKIVYYRIFYTFKGGEFYFSKTHHTKELQEHPIDHNNKSIEDVITSKFVFSNNHGYIEIKLPETDVHQYKILFYEASGNELFQISRIDQSELILDKTNFIHSGWFYFKLYEDGKLLESNKIFLK